MLMEVQYLITNWYDIMCNSYINGNFKVSFHSITSTKFKDFQRLRPFNWLLPVLDLYNFRRPQIIMPLKKSCMHISNFPNHFEIQKSHRKWTSVFMILMLRQCSQTSRQSICFIMCLLCQDKFFIILIQLYILHKYIIKSSVAIVISN